MIELYKRQIWNDEKTVNVIAEACMNSNPKIVVSACKFFLIFGSIVIYTAMAFNTFRNATSITKEPRRACRERIHWSSADLFCVPPLLDGDKQTITLVFPLLLGLGPR